MRCNLLRTNKQAVKWAWWPEAHNYAPISILSTGNLCGGHQSPNTTQLWYECHPCTHAVNYTEAPINDGFPLLFSTPLSTCLPSSQWEGEGGWAWTPVHLGRVFSHTLLLAAQGSSIILFLSPLTTFTRPLLYSICNRNSLLLQWQMHSINGITLILCHCQPDTSETSPTPLHQMGEKLMVLVHVVTAGGIYQLELVHVLLWGVTGSLTYKALMWLPWFVYTPLWYHINLLPWCLLSK